MFYRTAGEYCDCLLPFVSDGLDADHPVLVAVPEPNMTLLQDGLGPAAAHVTMVDMTEAGRNPGRILGELLSGFLERHPDRPVRMIGEPVWPSRSELEYPACVQHEALINHAFTGRDVTLVCPYDVARLESRAVTDARATHPVLWQAGSAAQASSTFAPDAAWAHYNQPLSSHDAAVRYTARQFADLSGARAFAASYGQWFGLASETIADLQLIINELATSSLMQAGACRLALWQNDGHLVCEARDSTHLDDPLAGRRPYDRDTSRGRGLYVVNAVADLVRTHTTTEATTIQAYLRIKGAA